MKKFFYLICIFFLSGCVGNSSSDDGSGNNDSNKVTAISNLSMTSFILGDTPGIIIGDDISVVMPFGTNLNSLVATYTAAVDSVMVNGVTQISKVTPNDFSNLVVYTLSDKDGNIHNYNVNAVVADASAKDILSFSLNNTKGIITGDNIYVTMPYGTDTRSLTATYITTGSLVAIGSTSQINGSTANNFMNPVVYTVKAHDGTIQKYTVTVNVATKTENNITAFALNGINGVINGENIIVTMPYGTNTKALTAAYITTGASVAVNGVAQINGVTPNNFSNAITYAIQASDGSVHNYTVTVTIAASDEKDITAFYLNGIKGTINGTNIAVTMPSGTNVVSLNAAFNTTGIIVAVNDVAQINGVTPNNFTKPVIYVVYAEDSTSKDYTVTVTVANSSAKDITTFYLSGIQGVVDGNTISVMMPYGTPLGSLVASYITSSKSVLVNGIPQINGVTVNNFGMPIQYVAQAEDGTTKTYTINVTTSKASDKAMTSFYLSGVKGTLDGNKISVVMPYDTDRSYLIAGYITTGMKVIVNGIEQVNGITPNNFTNAITYTVVAEDGTTQEYIINVVNTGKYVAVGLNGTIAMSLDGINWDTSLVNPLSSGSYLYGVTVDSNGQYIAVGTSGVVMSSSDGVSWRVVASNLASSYLWAVTVSDSTGRFVAVGNNGYIATSTNGVSWSNQTMSSMSSGEQALFGVATVGGRYVAVGTNGKIVKSENGTSWTNATSNTTETLLGVAASSGTGRFVAVGTKGTIITSLDGNTWTAVTLPLDNKVKLTAVTVSRSGRFVAVGGNNAIITSIDGINWTVSSYVEFTGTGYTAVTVSKAGEFVAIDAGSNNTARSYDGINWQTESSALPYANMYGVAAFN